MLRTVLKALQRTLLTQLNTRCGLLCCALSIIVTVNVLIMAAFGAHPPALWLAHHPASPCAHALSGDNLAGRAFEQLCAPPIDVVYTWVNGSDPEWQRQMLRYRALHTEVGNASETQTATANRFRDSDELRFSLRSLEKHAPWVRRVLLVTDDQVPGWLNTQHPRVHIVPHSAIFPNASHLPTFSSPAIEAHLHRIPGLSRRFLYFNDDVFLGADVWPDDFVTVSQGPKVYLAWEVPKCAPGCPTPWLRDGYCDQPCNVSACRFDFGDCVGARPRAMPDYAGAAAAFARAQQARDANAQGPRFTAQPDLPRDYCALACPSRWVGDKMCDRQCNIPECGFDGLDCGLEAVVEGLQGVAVTHDTREVVVSPDARAVYFNLTAAIPLDAVMQAADFSGEEVTHGVVSQRHKVLVLLLRRAAPPVNATGSYPLAQLVLRAQLNQSEIAVTFNVSRAIVRLAFGSEAGIGGSSSAGGSHGANGSVSTNDDSVNGNDSGSSGGQCSSGCAGNTTALAAAAGTSAAATWTARTSRGLLGTGDVALPLRIVQDARWEEIAALLRDSAPPARLRGERDSLPPAVARVGAGSDAWLQLLAAGDACDPAVLPPPLPAVCRAVARAGCVTTLAALCTLPASSPAHRLAAWQQLVLPRRKEAWLLQREAVHVVLPTLATEAAAADESAPRAAGARRRLLDAFGDSLRHVNMLLHDAFGVENRRVPAHMPHLLDVDMVRDMEDRFAPQFQRTSASRFRSGDDMQFSMTYFHYLMHRLDSDAGDLRRVWERDIDTDGDGVLSELELWTLAAIALGSAPTPQYVAQLRRCLAPAMESQAQETTAEGVVHTTRRVVPHVTYDRFLGCSEALDGVKKRMLQRRRYETLGHEEVAFVMLGDDFNATRDELLGIRARRPKFICLNDNMQRPTAALQGAVRDFLLAYFPRPSQFELPDGQQNQELRWSRLQQQRQQQQVAVRLAVAGAAGTMAAVACVRCIKARRRGRPPLPPRRQ